MSLCKNKNKLKLGKIFKNFLKNLAQSKFHTSLPNTSSPIECFHHGRGLFLLHAVATEFYMLEVPSRESFAVDSEKLQVHVFELFATLH